ncbi:response regulator [Paenibacillus sp. CGMCC 1.16610]|uniref:Response regulator n=1 Tax=Paenibacillus anseongense TaxID=2682845 RepID=A0ABW9UA58_9BACL|nr:MULTISPECIES: response regulator [Paenibacillus]MBA2938732.1 response regulator [Paenibacillus sp. CGMCC 1.16610]MVQ34695.1 response regulator [Paenibacillus anseongense]
MDKFTLMIVDDEKIIRDGLQNSINWEGLGFEVVAAAADGEEAIELFRAHKPQAVIMDIHMPVISGLEVLEKFKCEHPDTEVILLSGYDEFAYAKKGIQEGAFDYIIKLYMFPELEESLKKLHQALSLRLEETRKYNQLLLLKNDYLFQQLIKGNTPMELNQAAQQSYYCVASVWLPSLPSVLPDHISRISLPLKLLMKQANDYIHLILYKDEDEKQLFHEKLVTSIRILETLLNDHAGTAYKVGISSFKPQVAEIPQLYREAMETIDYLRHGDPENSEQSLLFYEDWRGQDISLNFSRIPDMHWVNWVYSGDDVNLICWMKTVFGEACVNKQIRLSDIKYLCVQIAAQFEKMTKDHEMAFNSLHEFDSLMELEAYMILFIKERCVTASHRMQLQKSESIAAVKEYVDEMYTTNLILEDVAKQFYFSTGYLSSKFKEYTGMTFSKYIMTKRIETACTLLVGTEMKVYEIANEVGYSDEKHFSKLFTQIKNTGPREYRKHNKLNGGE